MLALLAIPGIIAWAFFMVQCTSLSIGSADTYTFNGVLRNGKIHEYGTPLSPSCPAVSAPPDYTYCMEGRSTPGLSIAACAALRLGSLDQQVGMIAPFAECVKE